MLNAKSSFAFSFQSFTCILSPVYKYSIVMCKLCWIKIWMWIGVLQWSPQCGNLRHALTNLYYLGRFVQVENVVCRNRSPLFGSIFLQVSIYKKIVVWGHFHVNCRSLQNCLSLNKTMLLSLLFLKMLKEWDGTLGLHMMHRKVGARGAARIKEVIC